MLKSMTGFAKIETEATEEGKLSCEARSLNNRYLEINIRLPKADYSYEQKLREQAKQSVKRGKVDIAIKWERPTGQTASAKINADTVRQYVEMTRSLKDDYGIKGHLTIEHMFNLRDIITYEENNNIPEETLFMALDTLLKKLNEERAKEGAVMEKDLHKRLEAISGYLEEIEKRWPVNIKTHEEKLRERIMEATRAISIDEARVLQEIAIYMERLDLSEEFVRLKGHLENFRDTLDSDDSIGRKLDFIIQEMVREANTIGSKSNELYINERVIQIKVEIEKMREQAQNVE
ncbi:MAG: YicC family protein [Syntrophus sp. (in: bacteria)]|nr:YicC family protein [Syntrophus sp. (in: bacteria)]